MFHSKKLMEKCLTAKTFKLKSPADTGQTLKCLLEEADTEKSNSESKNTNNLNIDNKTISKVSQLYNKIPIVKSLKAKISKFIC